MPSTTIAFMTRLTATAAHENNLTQMVISLARLRLMSVIIAIAVVTGVINRNHWTKTTAMVA